LTDLGVDVIQPRESGGGMSCMREPVVLMVFVSIIYR